MRLTFAVITPELCLGQISADVFNLCEILNVNYVERIRCESHSYRNSIGKLRIK